MRYLITIVIIVFLQFSVFIPKTLNAEIGSAFEGKHFYISFMQNEIKDFDILQLQLIIVSNYPANIVVKIPGESDRIYDIASNSIVKVALNSDLEITENEKIVQKSVEVISSVPILIYAFNSQTNSSDCFTALPVSQWGFEYIVMSYPNDQYLASFDYYGRIDSTYLIPRKSEFLIMASEDYTTVTYIPKSMTQSQRPANAQARVQLNKGDCFLVQSYDFPATYGDLTGTIIRSDKPIGVISGHVRTAIPQLMSDHHWESKDHLAEMLTPTKSWGRKFYSVPFNFHDKGDLFRITAIDSNTIVSVQTSSTFYYSFIDAPGDFAQFVGINEPAIWVSNNPVQIGQYMMRMGGNDDSYMYDPSLVILPSAEQYVQKMIFQTVGNEPINPEQFIGYEIYLISDFEALKTLTLNADLVTNISPEIQSQVFPDGSSCWARIPVTRGNHLLTCESGKFSGVAYGYGQADSYALTLGSSLINPYTADSISPEIVVEENCGKISGTITEIPDPNASGLLFAVMTDASNNYSYSLTPVISDSTYSATFTAKPVDVMKDGRFVLEYRDKNGNGKSYTFNYKGIYFNVPGTISLGVVDKGDTNCINYSIRVYGSSPVRLDSVNVIGPMDKRLDLFINSNVPAFLYPGEEFKFKACFHPDSSFEDLNQLLYFYFDCNRYDSLMIMGMVRYPDLAFFGYDFADVCLGDTAWGELKIINTGNVPTIIDSLYELQFNSQFDIIMQDSNNVAILPYNLRAGETLSLKVRFLPLYVGYVERIVSAKNDLSIANELKITGTGIAPLVNSTTVNWGKRRIGSVNDTTIFLYNTGDCVADISYNGSDGNTIPFMIDSISNIKDSIFVNDSLRLFLSFKPQQLQSSVLVSFFKVDSPGHDLVNVTKTGQGTLPVIVPIDIEFDTIPIYSFTDSMCVIIQSTGNERLWIDYKSMAGDDSCFIINNGDLSVLKDKYIEPDSNLTIPISFNPKKLGLSEIALTVTHDAFPAFNTGDTVIYIRGHSIEVDTIAPEIYFKDNILYKPCLDDVIPVYIFNDGNVPLSLDSLDLIVTNLDAQWAENYTLPIMIEPDSLIELKIKIFLKANEQSKLAVRGVFNDTVPYLTNELNILMEVSPIKIDDLGMLEYNIGDEGDLEISGKFPHSSQTPVDFELEILIDHRYLHLKNSNAILEIYCGNDTAFYDLPLTQFLDKIYGKTKNELIILDTCRWKVNLRFLCFLADSRQAEMTVKASSQLCYSKNEISSPVNFLGVCSFDLRRIEFDDSGIESVEISPNPVINELCIKINLKSNEWLNLSIFNQNGKKIAQNENLYLKKGSHSLIFEFSPLTSGIYILSVRTKLSLKNIMFIITK